VSHSQYLIFTSSIDAALLKLRNFYDASVPKANLTISFDGSAGNAWPTDGSSNADIVQLYNIFDNSTLYDVSINIIYP